MAVTAAQRGREVRQRLTAAAAELIAERGWNGVSTRLVAERAGVGAGLVHYHFSSLHALLSEAALGVMREVVHAVRPALESADTAGGLVDLMLGALDDYTGRDPTSLVFVETYLAATRDAGLRSAVGDVVAEFRRTLAELLAARAVADPESVAAVLAAALDGVMLHRALAPGMSADAVAPVLRRIVASGQNTPNRRGKRE